MALILVLQKGLLYLGTFDIDVSFVKNFVVFIIVSEMEIREGLVTVSNAVVNLSAHIFQLILLKFHL